MLAAGARGQSAEERYEIGPIIGRGGTSTVLRATDRHLRRKLVLKVLHAGACESAEKVSRFLAEAQVTAQLQHPSVVPVHDLGRLADGRWFFTMPEVEGRTLAALAREVHAASAAAGRWTASEHGWTLRRLVEVVTRVADALGSAHAMGVVHRDVKPENVMVGRHGEVRLLDWGLAKIGREAGEDFSEQDVVSTLRSDPEGMKTHVHTIAGTPAFMSPEQTTALVTLTPASDVYSLGASLYDVLVGHPPFGERTPSATIWHRLRHGPPPAPVREACPLPIPEALDALCMRALHLDPRGRPADGRAMAEGLRRWLEGTAQRERALGLVEEAEGSLRDAEGLRQRASEGLHRARAALEGVGTAEPVEAKREGWRLEDEAREAGQQALFAEEEAVRLARTALEHAPDTAEAHALLARVHRARHAAAEAADEPSAPVHLARLRAHDRAGTHAAYLAGRGRLVLHTEPAGARVTLAPQVVRDRRLVEGTAQDLGVTPIVREFPIGAYVVTVGDLKLPVRIERQGVTDTVRPDGVRVPVLLDVPRGPDEVWIPAGWTRSGGDPDALFSLPRRSLWVDGFVIQRFPITVGAYLSFIRALHAEDPERARAHVPRERAAGQGLGAPLFVEGPGGWSLPARGAEGSDPTWDPSLPVTMVSWRDAFAYAGWFAARTGLPWRLPCELEWEKAAGGTDGRRFPWGDFGDPAWCHVQGSAHAGRILPVGSYPDDRGPTGVRDLAGGVRDWCADVFTDEGPPTPGGRVVPVVDGPREPTTPRVCRGGGWDDPLRFGRVGSRPRNSEAFRDRLIGFRLVRSVAGPAGGPVEVR